MDIFKLSKSLDELIYDVMMWIIFYPYTFIRVLFSPQKMLEYVESELHGDPDDVDAFGRGLSPPLFLFLSILLGWMIAPDVSMSLRNAEGSAIVKSLGESSGNLLLFRLIAYCAFPLAGAALYEWRTPGGIDRRTFRRPFYQQAYLCGPLALVESFGIVLLSLTKDENSAAAIFLAMLFALGWYLWAQIIFFRRTMNVGWIPAALWGLLSLILGMSVFLMICLLVL